MPCARACLVQWECLCSGKWNIGKKTIGKKTIGMESVGMELSGVSYRLGIHHYPIVFLKR